MAAKKSKARKKSRSQIRLRFELTATPGSTIPQGFRLHGDFSLSPKELGNGPPLPHELMAILVRNMGQLTLEIAPGPQRLP